LASDDATLTTTAPWTRFDRWAGALLMVFGIIAAVVATLVTAKTREPLFVAAIVAAGVIGAGLPLAGVYGLSAGRTWARPVAVTLLWWAILTGLVEVLAALTRSSLSIPLGAIAAVFVLRMRPAERPPWLASHGRPVALALALVLLSYGLPSAAEYVMRPGNTALSVAPEALAITATLQCTPSDGPATKIRATARWRWTEHEALPHGEDALAFRWSVLDNDETPQSWLYADLLGLIEAPGTGSEFSDKGFVNPGREGSAGTFWLGDEGASGDVVRLLEQEAETRAAHVEPVMIEVDRQQLRDDTFLMVLMPDTVYLADLSSSGYGHATITFDVGYVHAGRWTVWSDSVGCAW
jgi:hypothetical protein